MKNIFDKISKLLPVYSCNNPVGRITLTFPFELYLLEDLAVFLSISKKKNTTRKNASTQERPEPGDRYHPPLLLSAGYQPLSFTH